MLRKDAVLTDLFSEDCSHSKAFFITHNRLRLSLHSSSLVRSTTVRDANRHVKVASWANLALYIDGEIHKPSKVEPTLELSSELFATQSLGLEGIWVQLQFRLQQARTDVVTIVRRSNCSDGFPRISRQENERISDAVGRQACLGSDVGTACKKVVVAPHSSHGASPVSFVSCVLKGMWLHD